MPFTRKELVIAIVIVVAFLAVAYCGLCLYIYSQKPLFVNDFGYREYGVPCLPGWARKRTDMRDSEGTRYLADFKINVFVVVHVPTEDTPPIVPMGSMSAEFLLPNGESLTLKCGEGFYRIRPDQTIDWESLPPGGAEKLFRAVEQRILVEQFELNGTEQ